MYVVSYLDILLYLFIIFYYIHLFFMCQLMHWTLSPQLGDRFVGLPNF